MQVWSSCFEQKEGKPPPPSVSLTSAFIDRCFPHSPLTTDESPVYVDEFSWHFCRSSFVSSTRYEKVFFLNPDFTFLI